MTIALNNEHSYLYQRYDISDTIPSIIFTRLSLSLSLGYGLFECIKIRDISYVQGRVF